MKLEIYFQHKIDPPHLWLSTSFYSIYYKTVLDSLEIIDWMLHDQTKPFRQNPQVWLTDQKYRIF